MFAYECASLKDNMSCKGIVGNTKREPLETVALILKLQVDPSSNRKPVPSSKSPLEYFFVNPTLVCNDCDMIGIYSTISYATNDFYQKCIKNGYWWHNETIRSFALCCITILIVKYVYMWTPHYPSNS